MCKQKHVFSSFGCYKTRAGCIYTALNTSIRSMSYVYVYIYICKFSLVLACEHLADTQHLACEQFASWWWQRQVCSWCCQHQRADRMAATWHVNSLPLGGGSAKFVLGAANTNGQTGWLPLQSRPLYIDSI